jgi:hypothetical protein
MVEGEAKDWLVMDPTAWLPLVGLAGETDADSHLAGPVLVMMHRGHTHGIRNGWVLFPFCDAVVLDGSIKRQAADHTMRHLCRVGDREIHLV